MFQWGKGYMMWFTDSPLIPFHQAFNDNLAAIHDYKENQKFNEATKNASAKS